jgi:hypothetical protein
MPRLLDTRLIGLDISDVTSREYPPAIQGQVLQVKLDANGEKSMGLGSGTDYNYLSLDAESERSGISLQQFLCTVWQDITPKNSLNVNLFGAIYGTTYAAGIFYLVGADGTTPTANAKIMYGRVDNITGSPIVETSFENMATTPFNGPVYGVTYGDGKLLACGANGKIAVLRTTGWEACNMPDGSELYYIYRIAYGHRKGWVAVGTATSNSFGAGITLYSQDGETWSIGTPALGVGDGNAIYGVAYGGAIGEEMFVAVGGIVTPSPTTPTNHIAYSYDGINWTLSTTHSSRLRRAHYSACFGNGRWLVGTQGPQVGGDPTVSNMITSTSGITWESVPISNSGTADNSIQTVSYGNGMFISGGPYIYGSVSGLESAILFQPGVGLVATGASCYGNGIFLVGSRDGKLVRSSVINEIGLGPPGPPGRDGTNGTNGTPGTPGTNGTTQTVVTRLTSANNNTITTSTQSWVFTQDTPETDPRSTITVNIPVNISNTVERFLVNVRPASIGVALYITFSTGSIDRLFRGLGSPFLGPNNVEASTFTVVTAAGPCLLEFYRLPNTTDWYFDIISYTPSMGSGDGGGTG